MHIYIITMLIYAIIMYTVTMIIFLLINSIYNTAVNGVSLSLHVKTRIYNQLTRSNVGINSHCWLLGLTGINDVGSVHSEHPHSRPPHIASGRDVHNSF